MTSTARFICSLNFVTTNNITWRSLLHKIDSIRSKVTFYYECNTIWYKCTIPGVLHPPEIRLRMMWWSFPRQVACGRGRELQHQNPQKRGGIPPQYGPWAKRAIRHTWNSVRRALWCSFERVHRSTPSVKNKPFVESGGQNVYDLRRQLQHQCGS